MSGVFVFVENADGQIPAIAKEMMTAGRIIADGLSEDLVALVIGADVDSIVDAAFDMGADDVLAADDESLTPFRVEAVGPLVVSLAQDKEPSVILAGASTRGRDLAAWVAADAFVGPGVTVGEGAVVGARAVLVRDCPEWKVVVGNPAKAVGQREPGNGSKQ